MILRPARFPLAPLFIFACIATLGLPVTASPIPQGPCDHWIYPYSGFEYEVVESEMFPVMVKFNSTSYSANPSFQPIKTWRWDFGDGVTSTVVKGEDPPEGINPRHPYSVFQDHFDVCIKVTTVCTASDETCKRVVVRCTAPKAGFTVDKSEGTAPLSVRITDTSQHTPDGITAWEYKTAGTVFTREKNTFYTFNNPGEYTISQTVKKNCNPDTDTFSQRITVREPLKTYTIMNLSFPTTTPTIAVLGVYFNFTNTSAGTTAPTTRVPTPVVPDTTIAAARGTVIPLTSGTPSGTLPAGTNAGTATLSVTSSPAGADVYVDDVLRGASPVSVPGLPAGSHTLRLERQGYQPMTVPVDLTAGRTTEYSTSLVAVDGGSGMLPLIAGAVIIIVLAAACGYLYLIRKKTP